MARLFSEDAARAIGSLERGLRLSPLGPRDFVWPNRIARVHTHATCHLIGENADGIRNTL